MAYRPQYAYPEPPSGWVEEDFVYYFDATNTPALAGITNNNPVLKIPLQMQADAEFRLRGVEISGNVGNLYLKLYDCYGNELGQALMEADRAYAGTENGPNPIGRLPVVFEPEIPCPAGGFLQIDMALVSP